MTNSFTAKTTLKAKLLAAINVATDADQIVKISRSIEKADLDDDADLESALDTKVSALAANAEPEDLEKLAIGVKKLRTAAGAGVPTSTEVPEGSSNLYVTEDRVRSSFSASGDLSYDSATGVLSYTALPDALVVYATVADLPASGIAAGAKGIVEENKKLYIFTGASWVSVGLVDQTPTMTASPDASYTLTLGGDTVITLAATDPQGDPLTWSYEVTSGALGGSVVSQADNVFTVTGSSDTNDTAPFSIAFRVSDGTNIAEGTSEFTIAPPVFTYPMSNTSSDPTGSNWRSNYAPAGYQFIPNVGIETSAPITNMSNMLEYNSSINDPDISSWDVSTVTDMQYMFSSGSSFNQPLSSWDVSNVTNMQSMFQGAASFNQDLSSWDVSSVATMSSMLTTTDAFNNGGVALGGTFAATVGNHTNDLSSMFNGSGFNQNINSWNISAVTNFSGMFSASRFNNGGTPLTWVWPAWSNLSYLFSTRDGNKSYADGITMDITGWDVSGVSNMSYMFSGARNFNQNISVWDVGNVYNMAGMFYENWNATGALGFNQDLSGWDVSLISSKPTNFYSGSNTPHPSWTLPKPVWGTDGQG